MSLSEIQIKKLDNYIEKNNIKEDIFVYYLNILI
jgi:hypothetical protein